MLDGITEKVKNFYEEFPFPNYDEMDDIPALLEKANRGKFAQMLNEQLPFNARILEAGCGTGQLSNFLGILENRVITGIDICENSLKLAENFRGKNKLNNVKFLQADIFNLPFEPASFDAVISNGVLHHTKDPFLAFQKISGLVKKDGCVVIGLYNKYGRIKNRVLALTCKIFGDRFKIIDPYLRKNIGKEKKISWFMDQYKNPNEFSHAMGEVLGWFEKEDFTFIKSIPGHENTGLFARDEYPTVPERFWTQFKMFLHGRENGFFIMIGQKK